MKFGFVWITIRGVFRDSYVYVRPICEDLKFVELRLNVAEC